jgi:hypothetical protein
VAGETENKEEISIQLNYGINEELNTVTEKKKKK